LEKRATENGQVEWPRGKCQTGRQARGTVMSNGKESNLQEQLKEQKDTQGNV